jgi:hypothetical protein
MNWVSKLTTSNKPMKGIFLLKSLRNNNRNLEEYTENVTYPTSFQL